MIDYQELKNKFRAKLDSFDAEMLSRWMEFDQERDTVAKLIGGETVSVKNKTVSRITLLDDRESISSDSTEKPPQYAMAA
jgi:hypothetical protein